jgi:hypothetical protein
VASDESTRCALQRQFRTEYNSWRAMRNRCSNPSNASWRYYGAKGVIVCQRWAESFAAFLEDMGPAPSTHHQIDRIENARGYEPGNCRWSTATEQQANTAKVRYLEHQGSRRPVAEWARLTGIPSTTIICRIDRLGWTAERALSTPAQRQFRQKRRAFNG